MVKGLARDSKITSEQLFSKETAKFLDDLEQPLGPNFILVSFSWWERLLEKILRKLYGF